MENYKEVNQKSKVSVIYIYYFFIYLFIDKLAGT